MAVDYLSTLNAGSGLNTTQIVDALVEAERAPREERIQAAVEEKTVSISSLSQVKQGFSAFQSILTSLDGKTGLTASSADPAIGVNIADADLAQTFSASLEVEQLALGQTLVFDGYSSASDDLGSGSLTFAFGSWESGSFVANSDLSDQTITIDSDNASLTGIRDQINAAQIGVTASVLQTGLNSFALVLRTDSGVDHAVSLSASEDTAGSGLAQIQYTSVDNTIEVQSAQNAILSLDGVSIERSTNLIDDLVDGVEFTLTEVTTGPVQVSISHDEETALTSMTDLIDQINNMQTVLQTLSARGSQDTESGPLAGDPLLRSFQSRLRSITTTPLQGFADTPIYLTNFGIKTERDGSLTLDEESFKAAYAENPEQFAAIVSDRFFSDNDEIVVTMSGSDYTAGVYEFVATDGDGTLDGTASSRIGNSYFVRAGNGSGARIQTSSDDISANIYLGRSLIGELSKFTASILATGSDIDKKISTLNSDITEHNTELNDLSDRMTSLRDRYVRQFTAMEQAVKSLKETGSYLESFMDSWRAGLQK